jgi:hypothetical protein
MKDFETLMIFTWEMLPVLLPLFLIGTFIVGSLLHYIESEIKHYMIYRGKR